MFSVLNEFSSLVVPFIGIDEGEIFLPVPFQHMMNNDTKSLSSIFLFTLHHTIVSAGTKTRSTNRERDIRAGVAQELRICGKIQNLWLSHKISFKTKKSKQMVDGG